MGHTLRLFVAGLALMWLAAPAVSEPGPRAVETETITASPGQNDESDIPDEAPAENSDQPPPGPPPASVPTEIPVVEYDLGKLPTQVARLREQIIAAAATGDPEKLRPIIDANGEPPQFGPSDAGDPISYLKLQSGDPGGREMLAILTEVLDAGYVHVEVGTPDEMYVWPYFARFPIDKLSPPQLVELFKLVYAGDYEDMLTYGLYTYFRVGISPDGTWKYFMTDD